MANLSLKIAFNKLFLQFIDLLNGLWSFFVGLMNDVSFEIVYISLSR